MPSDLLVLEDLAELSKIMFSDKAEPIDANALQNVEQHTLSSRSIISDKDLISLRQILQQRYPDDPVMKHIRTLAPAPRSLTLEVNGACPLICIMCPRHYEESQVLAERNRRVMPLDLFHRYVDETFPLSDYSQIPTFEYSAVVFYIQNEPLLDPLLSKRGEYVRKKGLGGIVSSTLNVKRQNLEFLQNEDSGISKLICSVNAVTEKTYDAVMGGGSLERVRENLEYLAINKAKSLNMLVQIVVLSVNEPELEDFKKYVSDLGLDLQVKTLSRYSNRISNDLLPKDRALTRNTNLVDSLLCSWLWRGPVINALGHLSMCCTSAYHPNGFIQAMENQTIQEFWNSDTMQRLRYNMLTQGLEFNDYCNSCDAVHPFSDAWKGAGVIKTKR
jgi:MoaA/NifB/PqqE/SkfB family radical SAM enzyme